MTMRQTAPVPFQDEVWYEIPVDWEGGGGFGGGPFFSEVGKVVGMLSGGDGNIVSAVKVEAIRIFLDGDSPWTACRDSPSVAECIERAARQTRELAEAGDGVAQYQLGRDGGYLDKDLAMLRRPAEVGFASAQSSMGFRLKEGEQWTEAARWFTRSAEQDLPSGKTELALLLYREQGVPRDRIRAFRPMLEAARCGDMVAQYNVEVQYQRGAGTARGVMKARQWLQRAADKGDEDAKERLKSMSATSTDGAVEPAK